MNHEEEILDLKRRILRLEILCTVFLERADNLVSPEVWNVIQLIKDEVDKYEN